MLKKEFLVKFKKKKGGMKFIIFDRLAGGVARLKKPN